MDRIALVSALFRTTVATLLAAGGLAACAGPEPTPDELGAETSLYALVTTIDGTSFAPPLGPEPTPAGAFDATLLARLQVVLETEDAAAHVATLATFSATTQPHLVLLAAHELYWMNVPAAAYFTDPSLAYRFRALLDGREIGRSDMSSRVFEVMRYVPSLPIGVKLRIEARPAPTLTAIAPDHATTGTGLTLTVTGAGFVGDSVVRLAGTALATTFVSATSLTAVVPASLVGAAGSLEVSVLTPAPGGGTSGARTLTVTDPAPPALTSCAALHAAQPSLPSGAYSIDPDGEGGAAPVQAYCDMTTSGGGWTLIFSSQCVNANTWEFGPSYNTNVATLTPATTMTNLWKPYAAVSDLRFSCSVGRDSTIEFDRVLPSASSPGIYSRWGTCTDQPSVSLGGGLSYIQNNYCSSGPHNRDPDWGVWTGSVMYWGLVDQNYYDGHVNQANCNNVEVGHPHRTFFTAASTCDAYFYVWVR